MIKEFYDRHKKHIKIACSLAFWAALLSFVFLCEIVLVAGESMQPTYDNGDIVIVADKYYRVERNDVVIAEAHGDTVIKRIVGVAGDQVVSERGRLYINGEKVAITTSTRFDSPITIPEGYFFLLGDNVDNSLDSRVYGLISENDIKGRVLGQ